MYGGARPLYGYSFQLWKSESAKPLWEGYPIPMDRVTEWSVVGSTLSLRSSNKSKPKRTVTPYYVYMSALPLPIGAFGMSIDIVKIRLLLNNVSCFNEKFIGMKQNSSIAH